MASRPIRLHQPADPLAVDLVSVISEPGSHPSGAVERCLQVLLVYGAINSKSSAPASVAR